MKFTKITTSAGDDGKTHTYWHSPTLRFQIELVRVPLWESVTVVYYVLRELTVEHAGGGRGWAAVAEFRTLAEAKAAAVIVAEAIPA
jgi:hypothetical protein